MLSRTPPLFIDECEPVMPALLREDEDLLLLRSFGNVHEQTTTDEYWTPWSRQ